MWCLLINIEKSKENMFQITQTVNRNGATLIWLPTGFDGHLVEKLGTQTHFHWKLIFWDINLKFGTQLLRIFGFDSVAVLILSVLWIKQDGKTHFLHLNFRQTYHTMLIQCFIYVVHVCINIYVLNKTCIIRVKHVL